MSSLPMAPRRAAFSPFPAQQTSALLTLPPEIIHHIIALLVGQTPLGPPAALIPVMLTCKTLHEHATRAELLARVCRFKFDVAAVQRRTITPWNSGLKEHLIYCCRLMRALRRGLPARDAQGNDVPRSDEVQPSGVSSSGGAVVDLEEIRDWDPSQVLLACLMMLLDNDGKNIAQLEWAGVHTYVRQFLMERLWDGSYLNDGWPLENNKNACALWVMWLLTDQEMLAEETPSIREPLIERIFPFVVLPQRYPSSEAPPNHFHLPLSNASTSHIPQQVCIQFPIISRHSAAYIEPPMRPQTLDYTQEYRPQMYPHYTKSSGFVVPYFGASPSLSAPLSSMAAKLLYVCRREVQGIGAPPHLPVSRATAPAGWRGPTQEDYLTLNAAKGAPVPKRARWDWDRGYCCVVSKQQEEGQGPGDESSKKHDVSIRDGEGGGGGGDDAGGSGSGNRDRAQEEILEDSRRWETLWWRMRLCQNIYTPKPRFEPGAVYDPGCMRGSWRGKIYIPSGMPFSALLNRSPIYPGVPDENGRFSESSIGLIMQPVFLDIREHHRVCLDSSYYRDGRRGRSHRVHDRGDDSTPSSRSPTDACGTVPVPPPAHRDWTQFSYAEPFLDRLGIHPNDDGERQNPAQGSSSSRTAHVGNATPGGSASRRGARRNRANPSLVDPPPGPQPTDEPLDPVMLENPLRAQNVPIIDAIPAEDRDPDDERHGPSNESQQAVRGNDWQPVNRIDHIDVSMTNAWFPGDLGSLKWLERDGGDVENRLDALAQDRPVRKRRDDLLVGVGHAPDANTRPDCPNHHEHLLAKESSTNETWVYETFDPERVGAHEYHTSMSPSTHTGCRRCSERDAKTKELRELRELEATQRDHREDKEHRRHLERDTRNRARAEARTREHSVALGMLDDMMRSYGGEAVDDDAQLEDLDTEGGVFGVGAPDDSDTEDEDDDIDDQMSVLGDDFDGYDSDVEGQQSDTARAAYYENLRRDYSPSRIQRPSTTNATEAAPAPSSTSAAGPHATACPSATADIIVTGGTPDSALIWGRRYTVYGRVRPWDGLVGMLRVGQNMVSTDYLFFFGYVVGGRTFVGEWRIASSDVMRPTLGSAIVLSRYD